MARRSKKLPAEPTPPRMTAGPEVMESLWRVVDAARLAIRPPHNTDREELLEFLADQEKMLRRAVAFFNGAVDGEKHLRHGLTQHPYVISLEERDQAAFEQRMKDREQRMKKENT